MDSLTIDPGKAPLSLWRRLAAGSASVALADSAWPRVARARQMIEDALASGEAIYGVNTGFGKLAQTRIPDGELKHLQRNLVLSHAAGVGAPLDDAVVRLIIALKVGSLARGHSARRRVTKAGVPPVELEAKEGLALLNGTQVSTALALVALFAAEANLEAALIAGALSTDAIKGSDTPFDARIHDVRGQPGQIEIAAALRDLMAGSDIRKSHLACDRVQDPYSIRCQPQVLGPCLDMLNHAAKVFAIEANAATDNPLVFDNGDVLSGGNFHAEPVAIAADALAIAIAEIGALSERRIALLIDSSLSGLPPFLAAESGVNSGFMIAHVTAASLASENKSLAHPASVDSLPTSANQEDFVSMATLAARRLTGMNSNTSYILGIELLAAAEGLEFHR